MLHAIAVVLFVAVILLIVEKMTGRWAKIVGADKASGGGDEASAAGALSEDAEKPYGFGDLRLKIDPGERHRVSWVAEMGGTYETLLRPMGSWSEWETGTDFYVTEKVYHSVEDLAPAGAEEKRCRYTDVYGRTVLDLRERRPLSGSAEAVLEERYHHWYLVLTDTSAAMVSAEDGKQGIEVTEDLGEIPAPAYRMLKFWGYVDEEGILKL